MPAPADTDTRTTAVLAASAVLAVVSLAACVLRRPDGIEAFLSTKPAPSAPAGARPGGGGRAAQSRALSKSNIRRHITLPEYPIASETTHVPALDAIQMATPIETPAQTE